MRMVLTALTVASMVGGLVSCAEKSSSEKPVPEGRGSQTSTQIFSVKGVVRELKPDGRTIVYGRSSEYMAEDSTAKAIQLVDLATRTVSAVPGSEGLFSPRWSADGHHLVAMPLDQRKLMLFDMESKRWTELARGTFNNPVWSKDGRYIYYQSYDEGTPICRIQVANGVVEEVADFRGLQPGATVGYWGIGPEDAPIASFHFLTADIYSVDWSRP